MGPGFPKPLRIVAENVVLANRPSLSMRADRAFATRTRKLRCSLLVAPRVLSLHHRHLFCNDRE